MLLKLTVSTTFPKTNVAKTNDLATFPTTNVARTIGFTTFPTRTLLEPLVLQHFQQGRC